MELRVTDHFPGASGLAMVVFAGKLGVSNGKLLDLALANLREHGTRNVMLDLARVVDLYSSSVGMLLESREAFRKLGGDLVLVGTLSAKIRIVLEMLELPEDLALHATVEEARRALGQP